MSRMLETVSQHAAPQLSQSRRGVLTRIPDHPILCTTANSCGVTLYTVGGEINVDKPTSTVYTYAYITARNQWVSIRHEHGEDLAVPLSSNIIVVTGGSVVNEGKFTLSPFVRTLLL